MSWTGGAFGGVAECVLAPNASPMTLDGTNTWVLRAPDAEYAVVVDPGPADEEHLAAIAARGPVGFVLITHGHPDHTEGAPRLSELLGGAHVLAADPAHTIGGEPLTSQTALDAGLAIRLVPTPGHTADSVCFLVEHGDLVVYYPQVPRRLVQPHVPGRPAGAGLEGLQHAVLGEDDDGGPN